MRRMAFRNEEGAILPFVALVLEPGEHGLR